MNDKAVCLKIEHLTKIYRTGGKKDSVKALSDLNLTLEPGLYGLLGPNGAGKSTLIHILTACMEPTKGRVLWNGRCIRRLGKKYRSVLGYMPQQQALYEGFTGGQFLQYIAALKAIPAGETEHEIRQAAEKVGMWEELSKGISAYSGGMKQRLLAAGAIMGSPSFLILDEPTAGLDPKERVRLRQTLVELSRTAIVLVATHVVSDVESVADCILLLRRGELVGMGSPAELERKYAPEKGLEGVYLHLFGEEQR